MGFKPYAPSPLSGRIGTGACLTQGMPPIDLRFARGATRPCDVTYPQDMAAFRAPEFYVGFTFNVSQASTTLHSYQQRNQYNLKNIMFAFRSWLSFAYAFYGELFTKLQPCYIITPTKENGDKMCKNLGIQDYGKTFDEHTEELTADKRLEDCMQYATPEGREAIIAELILSSSGIGAAGHTVVVRTASEVAGVTGNMVASILQQKFGTTERRTRQHGERDERYRPHDPHHARIQQAIMRPQGSQRKCYVSVWESLCHPPGQRRTWTFCDQQHNILLHARNCRPGREDPQRHSQALQGQHWSRRRTNTAQLRNRTPHRNEAERHQRTQCYRMGPWTH